MTLAEAQLKAVETGEPQRFVEPTTNTEVVVLRADIYEKLRRAAEEIRLLEADEPVLFDK